jgi:hypothetical protein
VGNRDVLFLDKSPQKESPETAQMRDSIKTFTSLEDRDQTENPMKPKQGRKPAAAPRCFGLEDAELRRKVCRGE